MFTFHDKVVWVTGSTTGIGKAIATAFAKRGADVVIHGYNNQKEAEIFLGELRDLGTNPLLVDGDVTDKEKVWEIARQIEDKYGRLDILVNNVGAFIKKARIEALEEEVWDRIIDVNLKSVFLVTQAAVPLLKAAGGGKIVNITSGVVRNGGTKDGLAYVAAKGGVSAMIRSLAKQLIEHNILVNGVAPGLIDTPFHNSSAPLDSYTHIINQIPMGKAGQPEDIAGAVMYLASDYANYVIGEIIEVSGGRRLS